MLKFNYSQSKGQHGCGNPTGLSQVFRAAGTRAMTILLACFVVLTLRPQAQGQVNTQGQWTVITSQSPVNPAHLAMMHNGQVLIVSGNGAGAQPTPQAATYDPATKTVSAPIQVQWDMFCNGMVVLPDGRPFIVGGFGFTRTAVYDPSTGLFTDLAPVSYGRWYPLILSTSFGNVIAISGDDSSNPPNTSQKLELFDGTSWTTAAVAPTWMPPLYPRGHVLGNGKIFIDAPQPNSTIIDEVTGQESFNVATTKFGGDRTYGTSVLLPLYPPNYATKVLILGGGVAGPSTNTVEISSDLTQNQTSPTWTTGSPMLHQRVEANATILPTGKVLVSGGSTNDEDASTAALQGELYDPATGGFSVAGTTHAPRLYHSTALLLPDATVVVMGSQPLINNNPSYDHTIEAYQPAYLFNADGSLATRPAITSVPANISYGAQFQIQTPNASSISSVVLIRPGAVTHAFNMEQRLVGLSFTAGSGILNVTAPSDSVSTPTGLMNPAPPGYYMLFLVNSSGVPSTAMFVQLKPALSVSPISQAANSNGSANYTVKVSDTNAFGGGCVTPSLSGLPAGATSGAFNPASICGSGTSTVTVTEAAATPAGTSTLTFTGTSGSTTHRVTSAFTANTTTASATITFSGSEQVHGTPGTGSISINGPGSQSACCDGNGSLVWDAGTVFATVNGVQSQVGYSNGSPTYPFMLAQYLTSTINQANPYVTATTPNANFFPAVITLTARTLGSNTNYSLSASYNFDINGTGLFSQPSFPASASGATLTGGTGPFYDNGTIAITVNGHRDQCSNYGQGSTISSIALNCANTINGDSGSPVSASANGGYLTLTSKQPGIIGNYSLSVAIASTSGFSPPSFSASNPASLAGGH